MKSGPKNSKYSVAVCVCEQMSVHAHVAFVSVCIFEFA